CHRRDDEGTGLSQAIADAASNEALGAGVLTARKAGTVEIGFWLIPRARGPGLGSRSARSRRPWANASFYDPAVVPEAQLEQTQAGLVPAAEGWFVLNARDGPWRHQEGRGERV